MWRIAIKNVLFTPLKEIRHINLRVTDVAEKACQEASKNLQVTKVSHEFPVFGEVVEVASHFNRAQQVVVGVLLIGS